MSSGIKSILPAAEGLFGRTSACLSETYKDKSQNSTRKQVNHFKTLTSVSSRRPFAHILSRRTLPRPGSRINHPITYPRRTGRQLGNVPKGIIDTLLRFINPESIRIATKEKKYSTLQSKHQKSKYKKSINRHSLRRLLQHKFPRPSKPRDNSPPRGGLPFSRATSSRLCRRSRS